MKNTPRRANAIAPIVTTTGLLAFLGAGLAWIAHSRRNIYHNIPMTAALDGELRNFETKAGTVAYYVSGSRPISARPSARAMPPMVFIHSINAAPSSAEMRPLFEHYALSRRVFAIDLPGFGFSDRRDIPYSPRLYRNVINQFLGQVVGGPADVVALSLSAEFVALAAVAQPELFRSLIFLSPTGLGRRVPTGELNDVMLRVLRVPLWRRPLFDLLTSRPSSRLFLGLSQRKTFDRDLSDYAYLTSHQPNAEYAPLYFLAGKLFTPDIFEVYCALSKPVLLIYGNGPTAQYHRVDELSRRPNWRIHHLPGCGELVHFDSPDTVIAQIDAFLDRL
ncbi:MAG: alpha/beta hydrolase [Anaerolineae bacterium]|nr:alpha/beta hydrolase [Thermoflexales bacterium]MDW8408947.1 alpha/beta hydrolase [Anaerolineae bacterium]